MLKRHIEILQRQMLLRLEEIREAYRHSGNKGSNVEEIVRDFLRKFLPPYYRVGHGEVIDHAGNSSRQIDVIITNEYHPYLNDLAVPSVFIIEGVSCVGEVKSVLTSEELDRALENSLSFKRLKLTVDNGATVQCRKPDILRFVASRPSFIFAFESQLSLPAIKTRIEAWNRKQALRIPEQLDGVFILTGGSLINFGNGDGGFVVIDQKGKSLPGYVLRDHVDAYPLVTLLGWLSMMPRFSLPVSPLAQYLVRNAGDVEMERGNLRA